MTDDTQSSGEQPTILETKRTSNETASPLKNLKLTVNTEMMQSRRSKGETTEIKR